MSRLRSPLRFPGGKSKVAELIVSHFPAGITELVSPFFGGGGVELLAAQMGIKVYGYDGFLPLVRFWDELLYSQLSRTMLTGAIQSYYPCTKEEFKRLQNVYRENYCIDTDVHSMPGAVFFVLNRSSFSGTTMSGGCSNPSARFTQSSIDRLQKFAEFQGKLTVNYSLWPDTLAKHTTEAMYLDPPYLIDPKIYGVRGDMHKDFDHQGLATALKARTAPWLLSYNDCEEIRDWYQGFDIQPVEWSNSMSNRKKRQQELIIKNY